MTAPDRDPASPRDADAAFALQFRAARLAALAQVNVSTYWITAALVLAFSWWDWYVDPAGWPRAFAIRCAGVAVIVATGLVQHASGRVDWAALIARTRYTAGVLAVAGALAVLERGYLVGIAGLVTVILSGPYIALDRRDLLLLNVVPLLAIGVIMYAAGIDRFTVINSWVFIGLAVAASLLLARVLEASNRRAFALEQQLTREARTDSLTGLFNRRALEEIAVRELKRSLREGTPLSVILGDVDHFKVINDRHGHAVGDRAIRATGECLHAELRASDAFGRWGGEEFLAILPNTGADAACTLAERMRAAIERAPLAIDPAVRVTLSLGVAELDANGDWGALLKAADDALYRAKAGGRNRTIAAPRRELN